MKIDHTEITVRLMNEDFTAKHLQDNAELIQATIEATQQALSKSSVVKSLPTGDEIEIAIKDYTDDKICKGDSIARWYDIQYNFRAGIDWAIKRLTK